MGFFDQMYEKPVPLGEDYPWFNRVQLETISYCNRSCGFCPIAWTDRGHVSMNDYLYTSIVAQLKEIGFDGCLNLFHISEPTLDVKLVERIREARKALPGATIYISTNGDVLDKLYQRNPMDMIARARQYYDAGLTVMNLNIYDTGEEGQAQAARFMKMIDELVVDGVRTTTKKYSTHNPKKRYVALTDMRIDRAQWSTVDAFFMRSKEDRAMVDKATVPQVQCARPNRHIVIRYDGKVVICCAVDPTDPNVPIAGDLNTQTIKEVWNSEMFFKYRWFTQQAKRVLPGCDTCTHRMAFSHVVRQVTASDATLEKWKGEAHG